MQPVLPLEPRGKRPLAGLGLRSATRDSETVRSWWSRWPEANIGLRCDGLTVFDVDGEAGKESLAQLEERYGALPDTRTALTGKGEHHWYRCRLPVGNSTQGLGHPAGLDIRGGARGYVCAPPSVHASGRRYEWANEGPIAELPASWLERLTATPYLPRAASCEGTTETAYGRAALDSELERLLRVRPGKRNEKLHLAVFRLAQLVAGGQLPRDRVERDCLEVALLLGLGAHESRLTIRSGMSAGLNFPRSPRACARARGYGGVSKDRNLETTFRIVR